MFTKKKQDEIFNIIIKESEKVLRKELNRRAVKLKNTYKSIMYDKNHPLIEDAEISIDKNMNLNIELKMNRDIPFEDTDKQNIPLVLERGGGIKVKGNEHVTVGGHFIRNIMGVEI